MKPKRYYSSRVELIKSTGSKYFHINMHRIIYRDGTFIFRVSRVFDGVIEEAVSTFSGDSAMYFYQCMCIQCHIQPE